MAAKKSKTKPLAGLKNTAKGAIDHMEIHPARNSSGGQAFITKTFRRHPAAVAGTDRDAKGSYLPQPDPEMTPHEDGNDMVDHVANTFGVQPDQDGDEDQDEGEGAGQQAA